MKMNRRDLLRSAAAVGGGALLGSAVGWPDNEILGQNLGLASLPDPQTSCIEHIVVVMMENRSFDHFLGWLPNAEGMQAGLTYSDSSGIQHQTHALAPDFTGCSHPDPDQLLPRGSRAIATTKALEVSEVSHQRVDSERLPLRRL